MEKKEFDDSAKQPEWIEQLKKAEIKELQNENKTNQAEIKENLLVTQYFNRKTKALQSYSLVAVLRQMVFYDMNNKIAGKIVPGQVGEICGGPPEPYEVLFINRPDLNFSDHELFVSLGFNRDELLLLVQDYEDLDNEKKSLPKFDFNINSEKNLQQFPSTSEIENFLAEKAKSISIILPPHYENNFKPGKLVTITVDFFEDKNDNYEIKIFAGEIGIILDPTDTNRIQNNKSRVNPNIVWEEDEVLVYFPKLSMWHIFDAFITGYKNLEPFESDQCYILSKSYLLPLFFTNQSDIK